MSVDETKKGAATSREAAAEESKNRILDAALREFGKKRYTAASVQNIADAAGCTKGLIYHYFGSKQKLFMATYVRVSQKAVEKVMESEPKGNFLEIMLTYTHRKLVYYLTHPYDYRLLFGARMAPAPDIADDIAELDAKYLPPVLAELQSKIAELPLKGGIEPEEFTNVVLTLSEAMVKQFTDRYGDLEDRGLSHLAEFETEFPRYLEFICYGMLDSHVSMEYKK